MFTDEYSNSPNQSLPLLDVHVHLNNNQIQTDLHSKPTDNHQYLLRTTCHPTHTKRTISFSLALRLRRICSTDNFFNELCHELINILESRGYSRLCLKIEINRVRSIPRNETVEPRPQNNNKTPFVIAFNPALSNVVSSVRKNFNILQASTRCKQIFQSKPIVACVADANYRRLLFTGKCPSETQTRPIVAYKRSPNLRDLLVRSQLRDHIEKLPPGIHKCHHPRCLT